MHEGCIAGNTESVISLTSIVSDNWVKLHGKNSFRVFYYLETNDLSFGDSTSEYWVQLNKLILLVQNTMTSQRRPVGDICDAGQMHKKLQDIHQIIHHERNT